ncbi:MAG: M23 family peptidase, partial [Muribaculum sp.]|nr:M23 family peptidase [Muribaculum sp.]
MCISYSIISDNLSGIKSWRGEIDGKFALFELDGKTGRLSFRPDGERFSKTGSHNVKLTVTDAAGNVAEYSGKY